jgi:hypothetical protein
MPTRSVWLLLGLVVMLMGLGLDLAVFWTDLAEPYFLVTRGSFYLWALLFMGLASTTRRFARWALIFAWIVMFCWAALLTLGLDISLIPIALAFAVVPIVAFLDVRSRPLKGQA